MHLLTLRLKALRRAASTLLERQLLCLVAFVMATAATWPVLSPPLTNLPFDEWTGVFAAERLTGALLDRLTHHVYILEMNGDSYRLKQSKHRSPSILDETQPGETPQA